MKIFDAQGLPKDGTAGPAGANGTPGTQGPAIYLAAEDGEDGWHAIPGQSGPPGATGSAGPVGPALFFLADDGEDGEPGAPGPAGPAGTTVTVGAPATISDLLLWIKADAVKGTNGNTVPSVINSAPWAMGGLVAPTIVSSGGLTVASSTLNGLPVLQWPGSSAGRYTISPVAFNLPQATVFAVFNSPSSSNQTLLGAANGGLEVDINSGANGINLTKATVAVIGQTSATITANTWYQMNATYNASTGAYAFRVAQAAAGSGTNIQTITGNTSAIGYNVATGANDGSYKLAELIIFNRVLSGGEIITIESYLNAKWGV